MARVTPTSPFEAKVLGTAWRAVRHALGRDPNVPILTHAIFMSRTDPDGGVHPWIIAADNVRLAMARIGIGLEWAAALDGAAISGRWLDVICATFRGQRIDLAIDGRSMTVRGHDGSMSIPIAEGWPNITSAVAMAVDRKKTSRVTVDGALLADAVRAAARINDVGATIKIGAPLEPVTIEADGYYEIVMPKRVTR